MADPKTAETKPTRPRRSRGGLRIIARKELADTVQSVRFAVLLVLIGLAALASVQAATGPIQDAADAASQTPSVFLLLFTLTADRVPSFHEFVGILGPLVGIALGFDSISAERSDRTLSRLVAQPIYRDDVINGKFLAGVATITIVLCAITAMVVAYGMWSLGQIPDPSELARIIAFLIVAIAYVALWLALAILVSVLVRRATTAAFVTIAAWLIFTLFA